MSNQLKWNEYDRLNLAYLPTPLRRLDRLSEEWGIDLWIKRDDLTGLETSGNKIRKLEYTVAQAKKENADVLITCGGIQSNHCRATAAVAASVGLKSHLVLRIDEQPPLEGNYLLDKILDAEITLISRDDYSNRRMEIMEKIRDDYAAKGLRAYIIPEGASDGIGNFGYINAVKEIAEQEKSLDLHFDTLVCAVGSGGTYSGLYLGTKLYQTNQKVLGFNVCDDEEYFLNVCTSIASDTVKRIDADISVSRDDMHIIDGYKGKGYAVSSDDELEFIIDVARKEGVILDPVYTGKALYGFYQELKKGNLKDVQHALFIHTGGIFGLFPKQEQIAQLL